MKMYAMIVALACLLSACTYMYKDPAPQLVEAESARVTDCRKLGLISDMADPGNLSAYDAAYRMVANVKSRAVRMGATHIVWLHKNELSASAVAYECPSQ